MSTRNFGGLRLEVQRVGNSKPDLTTWRLPSGYHMPTVLFVRFTALFSDTAIDGLWLM